MRKNHHGKKDRLVKRVFALCLALAVICTCLVPVFATEYKDVVDSGEEEIAGFGGDEAAGFGDDFPAVDDGEPREVYDEGEAAGFGEDEVASRPVEGGEDNLEGGPTVKETEWGTVIEYDTSTSTSTDPSSSTGTDPVTQWSGEDDVVEKPDDKVVVSGDEIKKLQDMVVYRFWLKELNANDLQDITAQAQINNMTESEYLARNGEVLWNLYFIQAVPRVETIADYSSYIENPSSNRDPKGELRLFDYWYTLDEFGNRVRLNLTDPTSNILDDKTTTVNVYAAWKDGTVGSDEEEDVDHEDLVDKNPVPVDLTAKAAASYEDEEGNTKSVNLPVEVKNLPSAAHSLSVIHMGDDDMESFYESHEDSFGEMMPILGLKISPKNAKGEKVQPVKGQKATVTVSGLAALPEMEGATADKLKVLHETADTVETLEVISYQNGTLTFETSSFSPFVVVRTDGYDAEPLAEWETKHTLTIDIGENTELKGWNIGRQSWITSDNSVATVTPGNKGTATITGVGKGQATITHYYGLTSETWTVNVTDDAGLYILFDPMKEPDSNNTDMWTDVVTTANGQHAKLGDLTGATWSGNKNIFFKNIVDGAGSATAKQYIKQWPDGEPYKGPRVLKPGDNFRDTMVTYKNGTPISLESMILNQYRNNLVASYEDTEFDKNEVQKIVDSLPANEVTFTITPHKISKNNDQTEPTTHIDCTVTVTCNLTFTAVFNAKDSAGNSYTSVDKKAYLWYKDVPANNTVTKCKDPDGYTDGDGVQWEFDGWCLEDVKTGNEPGENAKVITDDEWQHYIVDETVLKNHGNDRVVNFYAHYRKATSDVTITKEVKGLLGDTTKDFDFRVSITPSSVDCSGVTATRNNEQSAVNDWRSFTLKHGEYVTLNNVPIGATITVTEVAPGEHYTVSATGQNGTQNGGGEVTFTYKVTAANTITPVDADGNPVAGTTVPNNNIIVTNTCDLRPDNGVLLDTLPYIVILAVVAGGVALLMLRKRRKEDD